MLFEGDGGFLMHVQELETVRRHGLKLLFVIFNDGAYGSEIHKLRADGVDDSGSVFGRTDLAAIAQGFGLRGATVTDVGQIRAAVRGLSGAGHGRSLERAGLGPGDEPQHPAPARPRPRQDVGLPLGLVQGYH